MGGFVHTAAHGQLTINSKALMGPAHRVMNLHALLSVTTRGSDITIPTTAGRKARKRYTDEAVIGLEMIVRGDVDPSTGAATSFSHNAQLAATLIGLEVISAPPSSASGYAATLVLPNTTTRTANVFVENYEVKPQGPFALVAFDLVIPAGKFA